MGHPDADGGDLWVSQKNSLLTRGSQEMLRILSLEGKTIVAVVTMEKYTFLTEVIKSGKLPGTC